LPAASHAVQFMPLLLQWDQGLPQPQLKPLPASVCRRCRRGRWLLPDGALPPLPLPLPLLPLLTLPLLLPPTPPDSTPLLPPVAGDAGARPCRRRRLLVALACGVAPTPAPPAPAGATASVLAAGCGTAAAVPPSCRSPRLPQYMPLPGPASRPPPLFDADDDSLTQAVQPLLMPLQSCAQLA
jgi:hypothetical protein